LTLKTCSRCEEQKPATEFHKCRTKPDGLQSYCKECKKNYNLERYDVKKDHILAVAKEWKDENQDYVAWYRCEYGCENHDKIIKQKRRYYADPKNKQRKAETNAIWRAKNIERLRKVNREGRRRRYAANPEKYRALERERYHRKKLSNNT
jgi:hypothetical protein